MAAVPVTELGTLNRLTNIRVAAAAQSEIKTGSGTISLNWPLNVQTENSFFARKVFHHEIIDMKAFVANDDVWTLNSQSSSQWDGLRHFGYQKEALFYNGVTMDDIHGSDANGYKKSTNGIQAWSDQGIVGRGVLVDWYGWKTSQTGATVPDPFTSVSIPISELKATLAAQGTELKFGDILFIRSGFIKAYTAKPGPELLEIKGHAPQHTVIGVEQSTDTLKWIWENFSAVAGDMLTFETWPLVKPVVLHEILLAGWGCPIGELFDLEKLAEHCKNEARWSFFVASEPCNVPGGVASPPNILAIF
ncbi:hypothetical protein BKA62DRAFT_743995 [Auriculariales sp. MPI-PUGE-AT-0066]|nr:hypothetical protein BKA62DRAFT_743995 [Auriculariales sp. MPI-PUGE-AT-0066]